MVISDMIYMAKDKVLWIFEIINDYFIYEICTKWFRFVPSDPVYISNWGWYLLFAFSMFLLPCCLGMACNFCANFAVCVSVCCYWPFFWKTRPFNESCACQIIAEFFMVGVLICGILTILILVAVYFDFYQVNIDTYDMAYNHMNSTMYPIVGDISFSEGTSHTFIVLGLLAAGVLYNLYGICTIFHIYCGFSCPCGAIFWYHYCGACLTYFGVLLYTFLAGTFFASFFFWDDFCRHEDIMWRNMSRWLAVWVDVHPWSEFTGEMIDACITEKGGISQSLYCQPFFDGWKKYICKDVNYFVNLGTCCVSLLMALMFCCMFYHVCYVGNVVRGDRTFHRLQETEKVVDANIEHEENRMENYYLMAHGDGGLGNEDEEL